MDSENIATLHKVIIRLLKKGENKEAARISRIMRDEFPDDPDAHLLLGVALMNDKKFDKSRRVIQNALLKFPEAGNLHEVMGHIYGHLNRIPESEKHYRLSIQFTSDSEKEETAGRYCYLADTLWIQNKRDDAITNWKLALEIDPGCIEAKEALEENINEYGEAKAPNDVFDDLYHFQGIHIKRYHALVKREEFISPEEMKEALGVVMEGWNQYVAPRSVETDNMTTKERDWFFKSITLDFRSVLAKWKNIN